MKTLHSFYVRFSITFIVLFVLTISIHFSSIPIISNCIFELKEKFNLNNVSSDSHKMFQNIQMILSFSFGFSIIWISVKTRLLEIKFHFFLQVLSAYLLAFFLLKYGFDKLFKHQFYQPEPNILYTPVGKLSKDILFWTSMGTSYSYNVFMGIIEIVPALLLFFKRTRMLGSLISLGVLINVFMINIGFDITVKFLSSFLIFLNINVLLPYSKRLSSFFLCNSSIKNNDSKFQNFLIEKPKVEMFVKSLIIYLIIFETIHPFIYTSNYNDDLQKRPPHHGAYEIKEIDVKCENSIYLGKLNHLKRIFIHRKGYLILQNQNDSMVDFQADLYSLRKKIEIKTPNGIILLNFNKNAIEWTENGQEFKLIVKKIDYRKSPLLQDNFL